MDDQNGKVMILTGPNMGGKSTIMRQAALNIILAQIGSLVPAEKMSLTPVDRIFTRIGGSDNLSKGESTFFIELNETASIIQHAKENSFVIIDELGRGTVTHDGSAIARAVYEEIIKMNVLSIVSSHYHKMVKNLADSMARSKTESSDQNPNRNLQLAHMSCYEEYFEDNPKKIKNVICLYQLAEGICPQSHGFACAKRADLSEKVIEEGQFYARKLERATKCLEEIVSL